MWSRRSRHRQHRPRHQSRQHRRRHRHLGMERVDAARGRQLGRREQRVIRAHEGRRRRGLRGGGTAVVDGVTGTAGTAGGDSMDV